MPYVAELAAVEDMLKQMRGPIERPAEDIDPDTGESQPFVSSAPPSAPARNVVVGDS
jgi:hypothetical protein